MQRYGSITNRKHHRKVLVRLFEYDSQIADGKLAGLRAEYQRIIDKLDALVATGEMSGYDRHTIVELSNDVIQELTKKYGNLQKEVGIAHN